MRYAPIIPISKAVVIYLAVIIICFVLSLLKRNRKNPHLKVFSVIFACILLDHTLLYFQPYIQPLSRLLKCTIHLSFIYYYYSMYTGNLIRKIITFTIGVFVILVIINIKGDLKFDYFYNILVFIQLCFSIYFYYDLLQKEDYVELIRYPHFFINTANIAIILSMLYLDLITQFPFERISSVTSNLAIAYSYCGFFMYTFYIIAFLCQKKLIA